MPNSSGRTFIIKTCIGHWGGGGGGGGGIGSGPMEKVYYLETKVY